MLRPTSSRLRRFFPLALLVCLPLALAACDSADDPGDETFPITVRDIRVEFTFDEPSDLDGPLRASGGDNVLSKLQSQLPSGSNITGVRVSRVKVDLLQPLPPVADIGDLNSVNFYLVNGDGTPQLVASGSAFTVGAMQSETTLRLDNSEIGSLVRDGLRAEAVINADPSTTHRVEIEFDAVVSFN